MLAHRSAEVRFIQRCYVAPALLALLYLDGKDDETPSARFAAGMKEHIDPYIAEHIKNKNAAKNEGLDDAIVQSTNSNEARLHAEYIQKLADSLRQVQRQPELVELLKQNAAAILMTADGKEEPEGVAHLFNTAAAILYDEKFRGSGFFNEFAALKVPELNVSAFKVSALSLPDQYSQAA